MKLSPSVFGSAVVALLLVPVLAFSQDKKPAAGSRWADEPGPAHRELARRAGEYDTVARFRQKPGDAAEESKGTARITAAVDGRFLLEEYAGSLRGRPVKGVRLTGYNNRSGRYETSWTWSLATSIMPMTGTSKDGGKTIEWSDDSPDDKGAKSPFHMTTRYLDDDRFVVELTNRSPDGKDGPSLAITYTRKK